MSTRNISRYYQGPMRGSTCPKCERQHALTRSRLRWHERLRYMWSTKKPFRCHHCGERIWIDPEELQTGVQLATRR